MLVKNEHKKEFTLLDSAVINLIVEKTKLNKEKYSLILSKTVIVYIILIALAMYTRVNEVFSSNTMLVTLLVIGTLLLFIVYLYVIEHFNKMDRDLDEVVTLLQTKAFMKHKQK